MLASTVGWRHALAAIGVFGAVCLAMVALAMPETLRARNPDALRLAPMFVQWGRILRHPTFIAWALLIACTYGGLFAFLAGSSFVLIDVLGSSRLACGLYIAGCSVSYIVGTFWCRRWLPRHGLAGAVKRGAAFTLAGGLSMVGLAAAGVIGPWAIVVPQFIYAFGHGIHQPCGQAAVVGPFPQHAGAASALAGFILAAAAVAVGAWLGVAMNDTVLSAGADGGRDVGGDGAGGLDAGAAARRTPSDRCSASASPAPPPAARARWRCSWPTRCAARSTVEFISVDSAQVYRGMDIGTAKPDAAERARVPHHLIDLIDPEQAYSAAQFVHDATAAADDIRARGRLPLLVGGTMLYFKALRDGLDAMPAADAALRAPHRRTRRRRRLARAACRTAARRPGHRGAAGTQRCAAHPARARGLDVDRPAAVGFPRAAARRGPMPGAGR